MSVLDGTAGVKQQKTITYFKSIIKLVRVSTSILRLISKIERMQANLKKHVNDQQKLFLFGKQNREEAG